MTERKSSLGKGEGESATALELEPLGMKAAQSFGVTGVDPVWKVKRDMAGKVGKGQTGLECPPEKLASIGYMVIDLQEVFKGK